MRSIQTATPFTCTLSFAFFGIPETFYVLFRLIKKLTLVFTDTDKAAKEMEACYSGWMAHETALSTTAASATPASPPPELLLARNGSERAAPASFATMY